MQLVLLRVWRWGSLWLWWWWVGLRLYGRRILRACVLRTVLMLGSCILLLCAVCLGIG